MASAPEVAVVVGAYSRDTFVREAVRSVLAQNVPRSSVEIVVTKNFERPDLNAELARDGVRVLADPTPRIGTWLLNAIRATRAPIVTLLDDDDLYAPERLARVLEAFRTHPEVGFYRNRVGLVDPAGRPTAPETWPPRAADPYFDAHGPALIAPDAKGELVDLLFRRTRVSFNSSSMAFRRELLDGRRGEHFAATWLPDSSLLLNAVASPFGLFLDDRRLTLHRTHPSNVTRTTEWLRWGMESSWGFAVEAREFGRPDFAEHYERAALHYDRMLRAGELIDRMAAGADRREVARRAADYARFLARHAEERAWNRDAWGVEAYAASYLVSPTFTRRVQRGRPTSGFPTTGLPAG
ncbi:MAG TPA: glycosyltransferase [Thermoplasmata archaeon]|nr:glycosyltransferase [Thermoplasmata archaeon]